MLFDVWSKNRQARESTAYVGSSAITSMHTFNQHCWRQHIRIYFFEKLSAMASGTLFESAYVGNILNLKEKVSKDSNLITQKDGDGRLLIHWAALGGHELVVNYLLENKSPVDPADETGMTPLILAASAGKETIVRTLIANGADVNATSDGGHSSLQYACSKNWKDIAQILLANHADINIADKRGATPLHRAASRGNTAVVQLLIDHGSELNINPIDSCGNTPLHLACEENRETEARLLVAHGARLDIQNKEKKTPLDLAQPSLARQLRKVSEQ